MGFSDYFAGVALDYVFGLGGDGPPEATFYVALMTAAPTDAGGGTEVTGGSYARESVTVDGSEWTRTDDQVVNDNDIEFPAPTANWGTVTHLAIYDASSSGNLLFWSALVTPRVINNGDAPPKFPAGTLKFTLN